MLFWIIVAIMLLIIICFIIDIIKYGEEIVGLVLMIMLLTVFCIVPIYTKAIAKATVAEYQSRKDIIEIKLDYLESISGTEYLLYVDIQEVYEDTFNDLSLYNQDVAKKKALVDNFWVGIWYPEEYAELELVEV